MKKCTVDLTARCEALESVMHDEANDRRTGISLVVLTNAKTGVERIAGVAARKTRAGRAPAYVYFNVCPFCRVEFACG